MKIEKEILQKKKRIQKRKILINTARSRTLENFRLRERKWWRGLINGHPPKKRPPPPCLDD